MFHPNSAAAARYCALSGQKLPQIVTHILQKAFFNMLWKKKRKSKKWKHILITPLPQDVILRWQRL
ncbi:hypothetical protein [uncultured Blautia sp.]|uniref:hypothetical protein n=1 Tax=unclassified Ruminococcus TaxID=2608920 RepID=UPI002EC978C4|nr:hypothetical protein [Blautia faecis]